MTLTFDSVGAWNYLVTCLVEASDEVMKSFYGELSGAGTGSGLSAEALKATNMDASAKVVGGSMILHECAFYADAIAESYGTGSLADTGAFSFWNEYAAQKGSKGLTLPEQRSISLADRGEATLTCGERNTALGEPLKV